MTDRHEHDAEERLRALLEDAVSDVEPRDALAQIRNRTKVTAMSDSSLARRPWLWGAGGAALATAAVLTAVAFVGNPMQRSADPGPATTPSPTAPETTPSVAPSESAGSPEPSESPAPVATAAPEESGAPGGTDAPAAESAYTVGVYYVGDSGNGPRLYREFHSGVGPDKLTVALAEATLDPLDPDYQTLWTEGVIASAAVEDDVIQITMADESVHDRPAGLSEQEAQLAVEQLIYTAQGAIGQRLPVQFRLGSNPIDQVYGVPTSEPLAEGPALQTLSLVNITEPGEGNTAAGTLQASGVANSFEANVPLEIRKGDRVVWQGHATAEGWMGDRLFPWSASVDVSGLPPGQYLFVAMTDDPSGGAEGPGPYIDTRTIRVE